MPQPTTRQDWKRWDRPRQVALFVQGMLTDLVEAQIVADPTATLPRIDKRWYLEMIADGFTCTLAELSAGLALLGKPSPVSLLH